MEGIELLRRAAEELRAGRPLAESVVLSSAGSVARPAGARMVTLADGTSLGTVGGGAPEYKVQGLAADCIADGRARVVTLDRSSTGMVCGGSQLVGIRRLGADDLAVLEDALATLDEGGRGRLVVRWEGNAATASFEREDAAAGGSAALPTYEMGCYVEELAAPERALIFGGGHVGRALASALSAIDFEVTVFDDRPEVARPENYPTARHVICGDYANVAADVEVRPSDCVCVMTQGHAGDEEVVAQVLACHPRYVGCMGSRRKRAVLEGVLAGKGVPAADVARVELPIGLELGAVTPAEIAVSIAARLIEVRHGSDDAISHPCPA